MRELGQDGLPGRLPRIVVSVDTASYLFLKEDDTFLTAVDFESAPPEGVIEALIDRLRVLQTEKNSRYRDLAIGSLVCALTALQEGTEASSTTVSR